MPHQDNSNRLNLERNLRQSRRQNSATPAWKDYEVDAETDQRPIADPELEFEADKAGKAHGRMHLGETQFLEGYGTTNFGVGPDDVRKIEVNINRSETTKVSTRTSLAIRSALILSSAAIVGILGWNYRESILSRLKRI